VASRRDFFKSFAKPLKQIQKDESPLVVRPPYGLSESLFQSKCPACVDKACVASCDEKIVFIGDDGIPQLNFASSGCTFCDDCASSCEAGVLDIEHEQYSSKIAADFVINIQGCVAHNSVICFSCKEPCIDDAILFNGMFNPIIDMDLCSGCGFCISVCPVDAIECTPLEIKEAIKKEEEQ
jgi:ferredoxin-type protein NapF